ncbi:hypothetical protein [Undibacterium sp.]|uniref:hypothetical protein n=1 Tax=Undibacterium sp. TaxID=1914977 RepID=UPI00272F3726|nr:hypothetical protein [Undibacterium sp.]MDP1977264.1 hypothetical protein [Undibacterium sp.]
MKAISLTDIRIAQGDAIALPPKCRHKAPRREEPWRPYPATRPPEQYYRQDV